MKNFTKYINRFVSLMLVSISIILIVNIILFIIYFSQYAVTSAWSIARDVASEFEETENGYTISEEMSNKLEIDNAFAMHIDNITMEVVWNTENFPTDIPLQYTASEISSISRGYLDNYSTFTAETDTGIIVLGYPQGRYFTLQNSTWDYNFIKNLPITILLFIIVNLILIFIIYMSVSGRLVKSLKPIISGIVSLPTGIIDDIPENGVFEDISKSINNTAKVIDFQKKEIRKKETARANWIAGVSHDIRTPLSMVMGYASGLCENENIDITVREQARIIQNQSIKIKGLIDDINLASQLEYEMQPLKKTNTKLSKLLRNYLADFLNTFTDDKYNIEIEITKLAENIMIDCDDRLIVRAINNLVQNSIGHNPNGCDILLSLDMNKNLAILTISDTGGGLTDKEIVELNSNSHYMESTDEKLNLRHGLGLLLVKQIVDVHNGKIVIGNNIDGGFSATITLNL